MYTGYFGLSDIPFSIAPNPDFLFMSDRHREALAHLTYGLGETGGFVLLTGEVGTGKTTVSRCLLQQLPENTQAAFILNPTLSAQELLATICDELKIRYRKTGATLKTLTDKIQAKLLKNHEAGLNTVLIIDEAQHLQAEVLEQLRLLTNLETNTKKLLQVILIGQPELQQLLQRRDLRQLAQRITARYHLLPLTKQEVAQYISHRLSVVNCQQALFSASAISTIHRLSNGIPRLINLLCDRALLGAYGANKNTVDKKLVLGACQEALGLEYQPKSWWQQNWLKGLATVIGFGVLITLGFILAKLDFSELNLTSEVRQKQHQKQLPNQIGMSRQQSKELDSPLTQVSVNINWPELIASNRDLGVAVNQLFQDWRIVLDEQITEPCQLAQFYQLACYWHKGNLNSLQRLGYPAVIKLYDQNNQAFYGNLKGINNQLSQLNFNDQTASLGYAWFNQYWRGAALIFWQAPQDSQGAFVDRIDSNSDSALIQWLEQGLSEHQQRPMRNLDSFDALLINQLQQYQRQQGLSVADYADTLTLLSLTNGVEQGLPLFNLAQP